MRPYVITICNITVFIRDIEFDCYIEAPLWEVKYCAKTRLDLPSHNGDLICQTNSISLMETVILQTVITYNVYQQISN
jgi:hypothetical protein